MKEQTINQLVHLTDFKEYGAIISELLVTATFVHDTMDILRNSSKFDGAIGTPTPLYPFQLNGLVQKAINKQLSLIERMQDLTSSRPENFHSTLGVLDMPEDKQKISDFEEK